MDRSNKRELELFNYSDKIKLHLMNSYKKNLWLYAKSCIDKKLNFVKYGRPKRDN